MSLARGGARNGLPGDDRMRVKTRGSAVHGTTGWPDALSGPGAQVFTVTSVAAVRDRSDANIGPAGFTRNVYGWLPEGPDDRGAPRGELPVRWWEGITARLERWRRDLQPTAPGHREGEGGQLCPRPRHCGGTESGRGLGASPDGAPRTEWRRSHHRQWPRGLEDPQTVPSPARSHRNGSGMGGGSGLSPISPLNSMASRQDASAHPVCGTNNGRRSNVAARGRLSVGKPSGHGPTDLTRCSYSARHGTGRTALMKNEADLRIGPTSRRSDGRRGR